MHNIMDNILHMVLNINGEIFSIIKMFTSIMYVLKIFIFRVLIGVRTLKKYNYTK